MTDYCRLIDDQYNIDSLGDFVSDYATHLRAALQSLDATLLEAACHEMERCAAAGGHIYVAGNGGSAAIAEHICCDYVKGCWSDGHPTLRMTSLTSNVALYSAVANDIGFESVFASQLSFLGRAGDLLIAISSSGKSMNIVNAVARAKAMGMTTIGLSGFSGGALKASADIAIHVNADNYGIVEDAHQALLHIFAQYIASKRKQASQ